MAGMVFFTDNYADRSSDDGYQFEFYCRRCGNGYMSPFQHSVTGFGGRLLRLGGDLMGGEIGSRASQLGFDAEFMRDTVRGSTRDKSLAKAVEQMKPYFKQCLNCGQWVCDQVCWNTERGLCVTCAPKLDQAVAQMQAMARSIVAFFAEYDLLITPALAERPLAIGECNGLGEDPLADLEAAYAALGDPAISRIVITSF